MDSITELKQCLQTQQIERETLIVDNKDNFQRKAQIELELQDLQDETAQRDVKRDDLKKELAKFDKFNTESEQKLAKINPDYDIIRRQEEQKTAQRDLAEEKRKELFSKTAFEQMMKTKGGLISFNNFLSTSKDCNISLDFACGALSNPDLMGILFVMTVDPVQSTTPFASIAEVGCFGDSEKEVLFAMHTVFRIDEVTAMDEHPRLFQVELTLTSDNDQDLRRLTDRVREETFPNDEGWYRLGEVLRKMGEFEKAQHVYEILLEQETEESGKAPIYHQLAWAKYEQGKYQEAITFYEKSLEMEQKIIPLRYQNLANSYNNIGMVYDNMGEYSKAFSSHEKGLVIRQQSLPPNHPDLAKSYDNIGLAYSNMGEYSKALPFHEKALEIFQKTLPPNHPDLAASYSNIGMVYDNMGDYPEACSFYERAVETGQQSLPENHPDLKDYIENLEDVKKKL